MSETAKRETRERLEALARFEAWAVAHPMALTPAAAVAAASRLYDLLPLESRHRPIDPSGVIVLHRMLARLSPRS
jgi:hypothetical protein